MGCKACLITHEHMSNSTVEAETLQTDIDITQKNRVQKSWSRFLWVSRVALTIALTGVAMALQRKEALPAWLALSLFISAYLIIAYDVLFRAWRNILRREIFDENFLMAIATAGAFIIGEYPEAVAVILFYQLGEAIQGFAVESSRKSIASLMDLRPDRAHVLRGGKEITVHPNAISLGERIIVKPGERIPLDGDVVAGRAFIDLSSLSGESLPQELSPGDKALSGAVVTNAVLTIQVDQSFETSTASRILALVEYSMEKKARTENFITSFAKYYTPIVVGVALILAFIPPLVIKGAIFSDWVYRALVFLVVSCPCALVISIPLGFFAGIGAASKAGVLVKGGNYLEALAKTRTVVFDKTGTLTEGKFTVSGIHPSDQGGLTLTENELLAIAAHLEAHSSHPISLSLKAAHLALLYGKNPSCCQDACLEGVEELGGKGIQAVLNGKLVLAGNAELMESHQVVGFRPTVEAGYTDLGSIVHIAVEKVYAGYIDIKDRIKADSAKAVSELRKLGVNKTVMLSGDSEARAQATATKLGVELAYGKLLPADKVGIVEGLLLELKKKQTLVFVGDGINDAPALALADVGIAMGGLGSDAAIEAADVVIMNDEPSKIPQAIQLSRKTMAIVWQNIVLALGVKTLVLMLSALGYAYMWAAVFADVGVALLATANAMRLFYASRRNQR